MIEKVFYVVFFTIVFYLLYKIYNDIKFIKGKWINMETKYQDHKIDTSDNSIVQYPSFSRFNIFSQKPTQILKTGETLHMSFNSKEHFILTVYDEFLNIMYNFTRPLFLIFSTKKDSQFYIEPNKKFVIFLRANITEEHISSTITKYYSNCDVRVKNVYRKYPQIVIEEQELISDLEKTCLKIIREMKTKGFMLKEALYSQEYASFPSSDYAQQFTLNAKKDDYIFIVCTNKRKNYQLNTHIVEINSDISSMNWFPTNDDNISQILLNNTEKDNTISIYERLYGISKTSKCLPFKILVFCHPYCL